MPPVTRSMKLMKIIQVMALLTDTMVDDFNVTGAQLQHVSYDVNTLTEFIFEPGYGQVPK